jgi:antitoxin CptB
VNDTLIDSEGLSKLKWRCRRGLLENDLFIERFFQKYEDTLTVRQAGGLTALMELSDNDLLDLQLGRKPLEQVDSTLDRVEVREVLDMLKMKGQP